MLNWKCGKVFRALGNALAGKSSPVNPGHTRNRSLVLESLEQRQLLSVAPWQADGEALAVCVSQPLEAMRETEMVDFCSFGDMSLTLDDEIAENEALSAAPMLSEFQGSLENGNELFSSGCGCGCGCEPQEWYTVNMSTSSNLVAEGGTRDIVFTRDNATDSLTVYFTCYYTSFYDYEARYGVDYSLSQTGSVTFASGNTTASITLSAIEDSYIENDESVYIYLTQPSSGNSNYSIGSNSSVTLTIEDNDEWQVSVTPSVGYTEVLESAGYGCGCGSGDPQYGEFTLSRTGQTDPLGCTPGTTVFFQMSGTATLGSDYNISREYYYEYLNYGTNGVYAVDFPTTGSVKIRVNPYNDGVQESDKTVQLTVLTPEAAAEILFPDSGCGCGCGCGNEYDNHPYRYTPGSSSSGTVTIRDDDWWKVGVATTDDTATERLYDVEQDYGEFTFTRTHLHPTDSTVEGDTTYGITVEFDMIYDSANPNSATNSAAQPGSDYALQYQSGDSWYSAYQISSTTTGTVTRYRYSVTIPYEETTLKVRLNPNFDWDDEGVLFDFSQTTQTPDDDQGENANLEITNVTWWDKLATWNALDSANDTGQIEIKDGAICLIRTDSNNDGSLTLADDAANDVSGSAGRLLMMNNDDDNDNNTVDSTERPNDFDTAKNRTGGNSVTVTGENDLAETFVYAWIDSLTPATGTTLIEADVYLSGPTNLIPWTQATKGQHLHYGEYDYETYPYRMKYETTLGTLTSSNLSYSRTFYVEADTQSWANSGEISANVSFVNSYGAPGYDSVRYTPVRVDINVDSNNDGNVDNLDLGVNNTSQPGKILAVGYGQCQPIQLAVDIPYGVDQSKLVFQLEYDNSKILLYRNNLTSGLPQATFGTDIDISQYYLEPNANLPAGIINLSGGTTTIYVDGFVLGKTEIKLNCFYSPTGTISPSQDPIASDTIAVTVGFDLDTDSNNNNSIQSTQNFELTANKHLTISSVEDMIEGMSGHGKQLIVDNTAATQVVINTTGFTLSEGFELQIVVSAGLSLWTDATKTTRLSNSESTSPFEDDDLNEIYTWTGQISGSIVVYVEASSHTEYDFMDESGNLFLMEGTEIEDRAIFLRLVTSSETVIAEDSINFRCENQNVIFCGIDGTGTQTWLTGPNAQTENGRFNSHTRNFYGDINAKYRGYFYGPNNSITGSDSEQIHNNALNWIRNIYNECPASSKPKIALVGWSRGAMISLWVANDLSGTNIPVEIVGLYDPVDMAEVIPGEDSMTVATGVKNVAIIGPITTPQTLYGQQVLNYDYREEYWLTFTRMSGWDGQGNRRINIASTNTNTTLHRLNLNASHGAIGGRPGYNDGSEGTQYSYAVDYLSSVQADTYVRELCLASGIYIRLLTLDDYGFPVSNPTEQ